MHNAYAPEVAPNFALDLPGPKRAPDELKPSDTPCRLLVIVLIQAHVVLDDSHDIILTRDDGALGEHEEVVDVIARALHGADEVVVDPDRGSESYDIHSTSVCGIGREEREAHIRRRR